VKAFREVPVLIIVYAIWWKGLLKKVRFKSVMKDQRRELTDDDSRENERK